tara:strand:+ start:169 stop:1305 length:1137 start_codon:yes stop_codon:yes gene_type:complete
MAKQYGEEQVGYVVAESTLGVAVVPAATDAHRCSSFDITPNYDRHEVPETRNTRSLQERVAGRKSANFAIELVNRPSGTAGTPPDYHDYLRQAFGTYTNNASTSDVYTLLKDPSALFLSGYRLLEGILEGYRGGVVQNVTFAWGGDQFGTVSIAGKAVDMLWAGTDAANGTGSSATSLIVDKGGMYSQYAIIEIAGAASALQVTAHDGSNTLTIASSSWSDGDAITPYLPSPTLAGSPLYGTVGSLSLDGGSSTIAHISGSMSMETGMDTHDREFGSAVPTGIVLPQRRGVTFNLSFVIEDDGNYETLRGKAANGTAQNIQLNIGTTGGQICRIEMPKAELDLPAISGGAGLVECSISGTAMTSATTAKEDELTLTYL